jgi:acetyl-CoA/propionyl-CoA carboxylase biotin carboxyl carrier protein
MLDASPLARSIRTLLVANRGEIAVRIIRSARELGIRTVAVYGSGEEDALHVRLADDAWRIPSTAPIPYLDVSALLDVAARAGADAVHPGYGFLAENAGFARACAAAGLIFVGPPPAAIAAMGDKVAARRIAAAAGVPLVPGSDGPIASAADAIAWATAHGYPVAVKAAGGGGGRGFRVARSAEELTGAFAGASGEAARLFANPEVYLERFVVDPRHIEIQIMADSHGNIVAVGSRDCSIQRRHQKLIEEAPAPGLPDDTRRAMAEAAVALARAVDYQGAGTVEFLVDGDGSFAFLEMNTRIQVEHPVTELSTGIDLVREQTLIAAGEHLSFTADKVAPRGHAIECRINAEDPGHGFAPSPGTITHIHFPAGMGIRVDSAAVSGETIHPAYDSLIAKVIAWGRSRPEATARMIRALEELEIEGVPTTRDFHLCVLRHPAWSRGALATTFLDRNPQVIPPPSTRLLGGETPAPEPEPQVAEVDGHRFEVRFHGDLGQAAAAHPTALRRPPPPAANRHRAAGDRATLLSPIQGTVVRVAAAVGDQVERGQTICVVEAMKMENDVTAHRDGVIAALAATPGLAVRVGDALAEIA